MKVYERVLGTGCGNLYLQALLMFAKHCLEKHDVDIVLQANEIDEGSLRKDDRYLCSLISALLNRPDRCFMTRDSLTAEETKALIGRFEYLVSSRFHSLVFGFSQGVPGIAVSWSHKYRELLALFGMGSYVQECRDIDANGLITMFEQGWKERHQQKQAILEKVNCLQMEADALFDETATRILESL
jgi:polysaccharide pyruvyl transferase WcaK-like protein